MKNTKQRESSQSNQEVDPYGEFTFAPVANWLMQRSEVGIGAKLLYGRLRQYAGVDHDCFPGVKRLAADLGVSSRSINRWVAELSKWKLIEVQRRFDETSKYILLSHEWMSDFRAEDTREKVVASGEPLKASNDAAEEVAPDDEIPMAYFPMLDGGRMLIPAPTEAPTPFPRIDFREFVEPFFYLDHPGADYLDIYRCAERFEKFKQGKTSANWWKEWISWLKADARREFDQLDDDGRKMASDSWKELRNGRDRIGHNERGNQGDGGTDLHLGNPERDSRRSDLPRWTGQADETGTGAGGGDLSGVAGAQGRGNLSASNELIFPEHRGWVQTEAMKEAAL